MARLGSIYDDAPSGPKGPDLRHTVVVSRAALARGPVEVDVPRDFEVDGQTVRRAVHPGDVGDRVPISAPADVPDGVTLRLRGAGGQGADGGPAGDLYLTLDIRDVPAPSAGGVPTPVGLGVGLIAVLLAVAAAFAAC